MSKPKARQRSGEDRRSITNRRRGDNRLFFGRRSSHLSKRLAGETVERHCDRAAGEIGVPRQTRTRQPQARRLTRRRCQTELSRLLVENVNLYEGHTGCVLRPTHDGCVGPGFERCNDGRFFVVSWWSGGRNDLLLLSTAPVVVLINE